MARETYRGEGKYIEGCTKLKKYDDLNKLSNGHHYTTNFNDCLDKEDRVLMLILMQRFLKKYRGIDTFAIGLNLGQINFYDDKPLKKDDTLRISNEAFQSEEIPTEVIENVDILLKLIKTSYKKKGK
jgi:hypothetical protein|tara:strand:- start:6030 stop:6410 length:381 start_codon:yes stop_codon:yes gene_type:complete